MDTTLKKQQEQSHRLWNILNTASINPHLSPFIHELISLAYILEDRIIQIVQQRPSGYSPYSFSHTKNQDSVIVQSKRFFLHLNFILVKLNT
ncbi:MAG: hypothetical protein ACK53Y_18860, partial [bacterium]